jgi:hypothetical protein
VCWHRAFPPCVPVPAGPPLARAEARLQRNPAATQPPSARGIEAAALTPPHACAFPRSLGQAAVSITPTAPRVWRTPPAAGARSSPARRAASAAQRCAATAPPQNRMSALTRALLPARCGNDPYHAGGYGFTLQGDHNVRLRAPRPRARAVPRPQCARARKCMRSHASPCVRPFCAPGSQPVLG